MSRGGGGEGDKERHQTIPTKKERIDKARDMGGGDDFKTNAWSCVCGSLHREYSNSYLVPTPCIVAYVPCTENFTLLLMNNRYI